MTDVRDAVPSRYAPIVAQLADSIRQSHLLAERARRVVDASRATRERIRIAREARERSASVSELMSWFADIAFLAETIDARMCDRGARTEHVATGRFRPPLPRREPR